MRHYHITVTINGTKIRHTVRSLRAVEPIITRYGPGSRVCVHACWRRDCDPLANPARASA